MLQIFSTREISIFIWLSVLVIYVLFDKKFRESVTKILGNKIFIFGIATLLINTIIIVLILKKLSFWEIGFIKDTSFWFLFTAIGIFFNIQDAKNVTFFSNIIRENIKAIVVLEFVINFYTFPLFIELALFPIIFLTSTSQLLIEKDSSQTKVNSCLVKLLAFIGLFLIIFSFYKTIVDYKNFFSLVNLKTFILPLILTILSLPFFYILALYINYESYIKIVKNSHRKEKPSIVKTLIKDTFIYANINLDKLYRIRKYQGSFNSSKDSPADFIKNVSRKHKYVIGNTAKIKAFNDTKRVIECLSQNGIGKLDEWHKSYSGDDYYLSMTGYFQFGNDDISKIPNSLAYYLIGEETYIKQLELVLDIGFQQNRNEAIDKFIDVINRTFECLLIQKPNYLDESIKISHTYQNEFETYSIVIDYDKYEKMEKYVLRISTK